MDIKYKKYVLKSGIKIVIIPMDTKLTYLSANFLLGHNFENKSNSQITHYYEHLMAELTSEKYKNRSNIMNELSRRGAIRNAFVSSNQMSFYIRGLYEDFEYYVDILSNTLHKFYIDKDIAIKEKKIAIQEYNNYISNFDYNFDLKIFKYLYPKYEYIIDHKYHIKNIKKFTINDVKRFIKNKICSKDIVILAVCPKNKVKNTENNINKYFGKLKMKKNCTNKYNILNHINNQFKVIHINNKYNDNVLLKLIVNKKIKYLSKEQLLLEILDDILFGLDNGIFYKKLRIELGLIYNISFNTDIDIVSSISSYEINTSCNQKNLPIIIDEIIKILATYKLKKEDFENSKIRLKIKRENKKFTNLTSYNDYKIHLLYNKHFYSNKDLFKLFESITYKELIQYYEKFRNDILNKGILFYYSKKNLNNIVDKYMQKSIIKNKYKISYI
tara:strand:+ start:2657 stop:3985 length:1329 start_codon:yes stop_codon:yes gene_type:complete